jgi:hypothetical protein
MVLATPQDQPMPTFKTPACRAPFTTTGLVAALALASAALVACGGGGDSTTTTSSTTGTSTAGVLCEYASSVFNSSASVNATATAAWSCGSTTRSVKANGLPDHAVGAFPNAGNPNTIAAQTISASVNLAPVLTTIITARGGPGSPTGVILNGVYIDPNTAGTCDNSGAHCDMAQGTGAWNIEALGGAFNFGTDSNNAHVQPGGVYHYHGVPEGFVTKLNKGQAMTLVGWAADGFPIYARHGYTVASDAASAIKVMRGSYRLKAAPDTNRPATSLYPMGTFKQDYEYVAGSGDLDECNGRTGVTPEFPKGIYHYFASDTYPYLQRCVKGQL